MRRFVKVIVILVNLLFALMYVCALAAVCVPPYKCVWFAYFGLCFPLLLLIQLAFVLFWIVCRKWWFLLSLALVCCSYKAVNKSFTFMPHPVETVDGSQQVTLLTYNVSLFGGERYFDEIAAFLAKTNADIVCLQEFGFYNHSQRLNADKIFARLDNIYPYRHVWYKNQKNRHWWGVATFSKYPIVNKKKVNYDSAYNVSVYSDIVIGGDTVRVFNNHLESNKLTTKDIQQYRTLSDNLNGNLLKDVGEQMSHKLSSAYRIRARQAEVVAAEVAASPYPVIVCGDFNDVAQSYAYHTLAKGMTDVAASTLWGYNRTFDVDGLWVTIDHVLIDEQTFTPMSCSISQQGYSDHFPVLATFAKRRK